MFRHRTLTLGGTFSPLHRGHKALLDRAFSDGLEIFIGLTSDKMVRSKEGQGTIPGYGERKKRLLEYLKSKGYADRAHIFRIEDEYGFAADFPNLQAIAVTKNSLGNAKKINDRRVARGMQALDIVMVELVLAEDGRPISSTRVRSSEINAEGKPIRQP